MKRTVGISLTFEDIEYLDEYAEIRGYPSRAAVVWKAIRLLRSLEVGDEYTAAWEEWSGSGEDPDRSVAVGAEPPVL